MKKTRKILSLVVVMFLIILAGCGGGSSTTSNESGGQTYNFKLTHITQESHAWHLFAEKFGEELNQRSDGRMNLEIFPAAQLGPEKDMVQQLETGSLEFAILTGQYLATRVPAFDAWNMPFLFETLEDSLKATETEPAQKMLDEISNQGIKGLGYMFAGNHHLLLKGEPIKSMEDLKGKKVRIAGGKAVIDFWTKTGASPVAMGLNEVYQALQTGVVEGVSVDPSGLYTEKFQEVSDSYVLTNQMAFPGAVVMSSTVYEQLSPEDQQIVEEAVAAAEEWGKKELLRLDKENLELLRNELEVVELEDRGSFDKLRNEIYEEYSSDPLIKEFIEENKK
ncbi:TRAP transporter substrate-binding protein [Niallia sp. Krafla_26]|uniref:TRAP transporter substrate-binding protein n=1 Tax=Niallia sp. Krafla_26 TaxID=3064703 RepID=UPI003D1729A1